MKFAPPVFACLLAACSPSTDSSAQAAVATPAARTATPSALPADAPRLALPIACTLNETCALQNYVDRDPGLDAKDYRCGRHTYQAHGGVDIRLQDMAAQRAGVAVLAAAPGRVSRLRDDVSDVSVKVAGAGSVAGSECGNGVVIDHGGGWETQYCHLAKGSLQVKPGDAVTAGSPIARVGMSGNTEYPHLHLTVRHNGVTIDPFAPISPPGACDATGSESQLLWDAKAANALTYQRGIVLNAGFSSTPTPMEVVEGGNIAPPTATSAALVAYARTLNLEAGDTQELVVKAPNGDVIAENRVGPLDRAKAQYLLYAGKKAADGGWPTGTYEATYSVFRSGKLAVHRIFRLQLY